MTTSQTPSPSFHQTFQQTLLDRNLRLQRAPLSTLQINMGKLCNQACTHCHVEAGPHRQEIMDRATIERIVELLSQAPQVTTVDLTGGAPELNPHFRDFVRVLHQMGKTVIDRCNLTVLLLPGQEDLVGFLKDHNVQVTASLPCYSQKNVDHQRGKGVFEKSLEALLLLNHWGYGKPDSPLILNLVYNPSGPFLPPDQKTLERDYKKRLQEDFGIEFHQLYTITNMPIKRFRQDLRRQGKLQEYMNLLRESFNPAALSGVMCQSLLSIGWDGQIYDCDFNQMQDIPLGHLGGKKTSLFDIDDFRQLENGPIGIADHCYGCTAGTGSSCSGTIVSNS